MSDTTTTPNMGMVLPVPSSRPGPEWAQELNAALEVTDAHDHTPGNGAQLPSEAIDIQSDLTLNDNDLTDVRSVRFTSGTAQLSGATDVGCGYEYGGDLYYNNAAGQAVQITAGSALAAAGTGSIQGMSPPASVAYSTVAKTFTFLQSANTNAKLDAGTVTIRKETASADGVSIVSPVLTGSYSLTLPAGLPNASKPLLLTSAGALTASDSLQLSGSVSVTGTVVAQGGVTTTSSISATLGITAGGAITAHAASAITGNLDVSVGDLKVYRTGGTTGVIFLRADGTRYLYYDGTAYQMPSAELQGLSTPTVTSAAATKGYVDTAVAATDSTRFVTSARCNSSGVVIASKGSVSVTLNTKFAVGGYILNIAGITVNSIVLATAFNGGPYTAGVNVTTPGQLTVYTALGGSAADSPFSITVIAL